MAAASVGGAFIAAFLQVLFDRMASREIVDFLKGQKLNDELLKKLTTTLKCVNGFLDDAEEKKIIKSAVMDRLDELKDAVYETDDLFDEIAYEPLRLESEAHSQTSTKQMLNFFSSFNPFKKGLREAKLEEILDRFEDLLEQKDILGLNEGIGENPSSQRLSITCLVDESGVYIGRDGDKEAIIELILSNGSKLDVISIVGMDGIGKTTLAQRVYTVSRLQQGFDIKAWGLFSDEFHVLKITEDAIEAVLGKSSDDRTLNQLQIDLKERLMKKKFLLVLYDVWYDKPADWESLLKPLKYEAQGSKIVLTTRNEINVASVVQTFPSYPLKQLTEEDWLLFRKYAFGDGNSSVVPADLEAIGREMVRRCKGLPLAAKTLGGVFHFRRDTHEWDILKSNMWFFWYDNIVRSPDSIGDLKHLRYLNLSEGSLERLPETLSSLYNLQTLILRWCTSLVELQTTLGRLINLCILMSE